MQWFSTMSQSPESLTACDRTEDPELCDVCGDQSAPLPTEGTTQIADLTHLRHTGQRRTNTPAVSLNVSDHHGVDEFQRREHLSVEEWERGGAFELLR